MDKFVIFCVGAAASVLSEIFWNGASRWTIGLWGRAGMLLLRRIVLRFSFMSRAFLCIFGAFGLIAIWGVILILSSIYARSDSREPIHILSKMPSFSYGLYRFLLLAPAYAVIEYIEACFRM